MTNLRELSEKEYNEAMVLYKKSIINKNLSYFLEDIQDEFEEYCQETDLCFADGQSAINIDVFYQYDFNYKIGIHLVPHKNTSDFVKRHPLPTEVVNWKLYPLTNRGILEMTKDHRELLKDVAMYTNFDIESLYNLSDSLNDYKEKTLLITHKERGKNI